MIEQQAHPSVRLLRSINALAGESGALIAFEGTPGEAGSQGHSGALSYIKPVHVRLSIPAAAEQSEDSVQLSKRETEILELLTQGLANKEIADRLSLSTETVRVHLRRIYEKLHVHSRTEAAMKCREGTGATRHPV